MNDLGNQDIGVEGEKVTELNHGGGQILDTMLEWNLTFVNCASSN